MVSSRWYNRVEDHCNAFCSAGVPYNYYVNGVADQCDCVEGVPTNVPLYPPYDDNGTFGKWKMHSFLVKLSSFSFCLPAFVWVHGSPGNCNARKAHPPPNLYRTGLCGQSTMTLMQVITVACHTVARTQVTGTEMTIDEIENAAVH